MLDKQEIVFRVLLKKLIHLFDTLGKQSEILGGTLKIVTVIVLRIYFISFYVNINIFTKKKVNYLVKIYFNVMKII